MPMPFETIDGLGLLIIVVIAWATYALTHPKPVRDEVSEDTARDRLPEGFFDTEGGEES